MLIPMSLGQQTAAVRALFARGMIRARSNGRKRTPTQPVRRKAKAARRANGRVRLVKGSKAAKAYMARIRKMRKR